MEGGRQRTPSNPHRRSDSDSPYRLPGRDSPDEAQPREGQWLIGVAVIVVVVLAFALMGHGTR